MNTWYRLLIILLVTILLISCQKDNDEEAIINFVKEIREKISKKPVQPPDTKTTPIEPVQKPALPKNNPNPFKPIGAEPSPENLDQSPTETTQGNLILIGIITDGTKYWAAIRGKDGKIYFVTPGMIGKVKVISINERTVKLMIQLGSESSEVILRLQQN